MHFPDISYIVNLLNINKMFDNFFSVNIKPEPKPNRNKRSKQHPQRKQTSKIKNKHFKGFLRC